MKNRNSVQNAMVESFWALTATIFVTISMFMSRGPKFDIDPRKRRCHKVVRTEILCRMHRSRAPQLSRWPFSWKITNSTPIQKNVVIAKLFAQSFCAECTGRELHSSHGDPFREKSKFWPRSQKMSSSQSCSHQNSVQDALIESSTALTATLFMNF